MPKRFNEGDLVKMEKGTVFNMMLDKNTHTYDFVKFITELQVEKPYEILYIFKDHPTRGENTDMCSKCVFKDGCSYRVIVLKGLESFGWCENFFTAA